MKKTFSLALIIIFTSFLCALEPNMIDSQAFSNIKNFNFDLKFENIFIEDIYGDEILVEFYSNNKKKCPLLYAEENTLYIKSSNFSLYPSDYCNIKIYIPHESSFEEVKIINKNGQTIIQNIKTDEISIKSESGKIKIQKIEAPLNIKLSSISGLIDINSVQTETISVINDKESVYISSLRSDYFDVSTNSGFVELSLETQIKASSHIKTKTGDIQLIIMEKSGFDLIAFSNSGALKDEINNLRLSPRNEFRNSYFGGGPEIQIQSNSGNIVLKGNLF